MIGRRTGTSVLGFVVAVVLLAGCAYSISGTATWPGAKLQKVVLTAGDLPTGVRYDRIVEDPRRSDGAGGPAAMLSVPEGCSNGLTEVIARSAERGPGSAVKYAVSYDGARVVMTVLSWQLNLGQLAAMASRCEHFDAYFDRTSAGIPITTTKLPSDRPDELLYQQTMRLNGSDTTVFMSFENIDRMATFGMALPARDLDARQGAMPKATLPQTFTEVVNKQADKVRAG
ncbi:hypothetical protein [Mycobacterium sp.]|uniref:hypothetical protein n=1 Tax=Mycobacterium sp. TaxID=1785 RepID=UPI002D6EE95B|nr:hypothetical protein [Mycobacterium sp.]HZA09619.1 hypothetical protein [Mycobacterium sp.]